MSMVNVIVIDDDPVTRLGIIRVELENCEDIKVIDTGKDGSEALALYRKHHKNKPVVLLDLEMQKNGIFAAEDILRFFPNAKIVIYSSAVNAISIGILRNTGAVGFVKKGPGSVEIPTAIRCAAQGDIFYCAESAKINSVNKSTIMLFNRLTSRERIVTFMLGFNFSLINISKSMYRNVKTIYGHKTNALRKLNLSSARDLLSLAEKKHLYNSSKHAFENDDIKFSH